MEIIAIIMSLLYIVLALVTGYSYFKYVYRTKDQLIKSVNLYGIVKYLMLIIFAYFTIAILVPSDRSIYNLCMIVCLGIFALEQYFISRKMYIYDNYIYYAGQVYKYSSITSIEFPESDGEREEMILNTNARCIVFKIDKEQKDKVSEIFLSKIATKVKV